MQIFKEENIKLEDLHIIWIFLINLLVIFRLNTKIKSRMLVRSNRIKCQKTPSKELEIKTIEIENDLL
jgi:hypothetical protein